MKHNMESIAGASGALAQYAKALVGALEKTSLPEWLGDGESVWDDVALMMPQQAKAAGYLHAPAICIELSGLDLAGSTAVWRGEQICIDVPSGYRAVATTSYVVQILPEEEAQPFETSATCDDTFLDYRTRRIRQLNDLLRTTGFGGKVVLSRGVKDLSTSDEVLRAVMT